MCGRWVSRHGCGPDACSRCVVSHWLQTLGEGDWPIVLVLCALSGCDVLWRAVARHLFSAKLAAFLARLCASSDPFSATAMEKQGHLSPQAAASNFWVLDKDGLVTQARPNVPDYVSRFARPEGEASREGAGLLDVVKAVQPTVLLGLAGECEEGLTQVSPQLTAQGCRVHRMWDSIKFKLCAASYAGFTGPSGSCHPGHQGLGGINPYHQLLGDCVAL